MNRKRISILAGAVVLAGAGTGAALAATNSAGQPGSAPAAVSSGYSAPGGYQYLCPVPGHAEEGMAGSFTVR